MPRYEDYYPLIVRLASRFNKKYPHFPIDDLIGEANVTFVKCVTAFDPEKAQFSTFLYRSITFQFYSMLRFKTPQFVYDVDVIEGSENPERHAMFRKVLSSFKDDAADIVSIILEVPKDLMEAIREESKAHRGRIRINKKIIEKYLQFKGWKIKRIKSAFGEITETLQTI